MNARQLKQLTTLQKLVICLPLSILVLERFMGSNELIIDKEITSGNSNFLAKDTSNWNVTMQIPSGDAVKFPEEIKLPSNKEHQPDRSKGIQVPLEYLTGQSYSCATIDLVSIENVVSSIPADIKFKIPKQVHQTSKSRCLTPRIASITETWKLGDDWSYYFHDDDAMARLFSLDWSNVFPHLHQVHKCISSRGTLLADLWRYLILYEYGGVYADIDSSPTKFNAATIQPDDEGFFIVEQYHLLSQYFMAMAPKHPLMYYAIHSTLLQILQVPDTGRIIAPEITGPHALHQGFIHYRKDVGVGVPKFGPGRKVVWKGIFPGTDNTTIRVEGRGEDENEYVRRETISRGEKQNEYKKLNMVHFSKDVQPTGKSCFTTMFEARDDSRRRLLEYSKHGDWKP